MYTYVATEKERERERRMHESMDGTIDPWIHRYTDSDTQIDK